MDNFVVSARKYRPKTFSTVVGQETITNTLKNAIRNQQIAQAFLFTGPRGVGKTTCARIFAKTINCTNLTDEGEACDSCDSCKAFGKTSSFNVFELDAASNNSVEDIRLLVDQVRIPPQVGKYKVYIIDEVHMLSSQAFNAFLKTLEEPPAYAKFILATTEKFKIIPTILSRCQIFDFRRINVEDIANHLAYVAKSEDVQADTEALHVIAQKADGALRDALSMFDQLVSFSGDRLQYEHVLENLNVLDIEYYFRLTNHFLKADARSALLILNEIMDNGFDGQHFVIGLGEHLRNLLVSQDAATVELLETSKSIKAHYLEQVSQCSPAFLLKALEIVNQCDLNYKISNNKRLLIELSLLRICSLVEAPSGKAPEGMVVLPADKVVSTSPNPKFDKGLSGESQRPQAEGPLLKPVEIVSEPPARSTVTNVSPTPPISREADRSLSGESQKPQTAQRNLSPDETVSESPLMAAESETKFNPTEAEKPAKTAAPAPVRNSDPEKITKSKTYSGLNVGDLMSAASIPIEKTEEEKEELPPDRDTFTVETLHRVWEQMAATVLEEPDFKHTLTNAMPELENDVVISFYVSNRIQHAEINHKKAWMLDFLRKKLNNYGITLETYIREIEPASKVAYTDEEKFKEMSDKNPSLSAFKDQLGLELEL